MDGMELVPYGDTIEVYLRHQVVLNKDNALFNFKQYLAQVEKEFEQEYTKRIYQSIITTS